MKQETIISKLQMRRVGGKIYLIDNIHAGLPYHKPILVNESGAEIFEQIKKAEDVRDAARRMADFYEVDEDMVYRDIRQFIETIEKNYAEWK